MIELARPWALLLLVPVAVGFWLHRRADPQPEALRHSRLSLLPDSGSLRVRLCNLAPWLTALAMVLMVIAVGILPILRIPVEVCCRAGKRSGIALLVEGVDVAVGAARV